MTLPDSDTLSTYGGPMVNYAPVEDPTTDRDAAAANEAYASTAAMTRTACRCMTSMTSAATTGALFLNNYEAVWKATTATAPVMVRTGTGVITYTWPSSVQDELLVSHSPNLLYGHASARGAVAYHTNVTVATNVVTLYIFDMAGTASDAVGVKFDVFAY